MKYMRLILEEIETMLVNGVPEVAGIFAETEIVVA